MGNEAKNLNDDRERRLESIRTRIKGIDKWISRCESIAAAFLGSGFIVFLLQFYLPRNPSELATWLAASAGPFTVAGFILVAVANYQQQKQFLVSERSEIENEGHREQQTKLEQDLILERECERLLEVYIRLQTSIDLLRPNFQIEGGASTKGSSGFSLLKSELDRVSWSERRGGQVAGSEKLPPTAKERLAPFLVAVGGIMKAVNGLSAERQAQFRTKLTALTTEEERHVISLLQKEESSQRGKTLNDWLKQPPNA